MPFTINRHNQELYFFDKILENEFLGQPHKWITQTHYLDIKGNIRTIDNLLVKKGPFG